MGRVRSALPSARMRKMAWFRPIGNEERSAHMTRSASESDCGELLFHKRDKICDLLAGERSKDRPGSPKVRQGTLQSSAPSYLESRAIPMTFCTDGAAIHEGALSVAF
jgi:hypothetical protein